MSRSTGIDRAERVRDVNAAEHLDVAARRDRVELVELELAVFVHWNDRELGSRASGDVLPGDEVGVVLHLRDDHEVTRAEVVESPAVGDEVDRRRDVVREDDLACRLRVHERARLLAGAFVGLGRAFPEVVDAAMDVRVRRLVEARHRLEDGARLLRRCGGVEVGERLVVDQLLEDREVLAQLARVELRRGAHSHALIVPRRWKAIPECGLRARSGARRAPARTRSGRRSPGRSRARSGARPRHGRARGPCSRRARRDRPG